ncbi:hypothetical protein BTVI_51713 [Pitangus sulphuratus]|nr:hypothetical protein BTVI_51713 [Pitangus sulphuratus]
MDQGETKVTKWLLNVDIRHKQIHYIPDFISEDGCLSESSIFCVTGLCRITCYPRDTITIVDGLGSLSQLELALSDMEEAAGVFSQKPPLTTKILPKPSKDWKIF